MIAPYLFVGGILLIVGVLFSWLYRLFTEDLD